MIVDAHTRIFEGALATLRSGAAVTLESAAVASGLTKPGLMYHFHTKESLMLGLVAYVVGKWEQGLLERLGKAVSEARPAERIRAYIDFALTTHFDEADIVMLADPRLRETLSARWAESMAPWLDLPDSLPLEHRARLTAVRLLGDGLWFAGAASFFVPEPAELSLIRAVADEILEGIG